MYVWFVPVGISYDEVTQMSKEEPDLVRRVRSADLPEMATRHMESYRNRIRILK